MQEPVVCFADSGGHLEDSALKLHVTVLSSSVLKQEINVIAQLTESCQVSRLTIVFLKMDEIF